MSTPDLEYVIRRRIRALEKSAAYYRGLAKQSTEGPASTYWDGTADTCAAAASLLRHDLAEAGDVGLALP